MHEIQEKIESILEKVIQSVNSESMPLIIQIRNRKRSDNTFKNIKFQSKSAKSFCKSI